MARMPPPPAPCRLRPMMITFIVGAPPDIADPATNMRRLPSIAGLRPRMCARDPTSGMSAVEVKEKLQIRGQT